MTVASVGRVALVGAALGGSLLAGTRLRRAYREDVLEAYAAVEEAPSALLETSAGDVEYATRGDGMPVLVAHGIVGGFDQALQTGQSLFEAETECIGVSRFGYLGSDLPVDSTPEAQASAYRHVLDHLGVTETVVVGTSAGGAPAIRFALDYPDRTRALVLMGSTAPSEAEIAGATGPPHVILRDPVFWALVTHAPWVFLRLFGVDGDDYADAAPEEQRRVDALLETLLPVEPRKPGIYNDERVTNTAMVERHDEYDLASLRVPTLIVHAEDDPLASFEDAERMAARIPDATFRPFRTGGHLVFGHGDAVRRTVTDFAASA